MLRQIERCNPDDCNSDILVETLAILFLLTSSIIFITEREPSSLKALDTSRRQILQKLPKNYSLNYSQAENNLEDIKKKHSSDVVTVETSGKRAISFYKDKLEFKHIGKKLRFFKNMSIFKKNY